MHNIAIIGMGGMGQAVYRLAMAKNYFVDTIDPNPDASALYPTFMVGHARDADVVIDCSLGEHLLNHLDICAKERTNMLVVATGWYDKLPQVKPIVKKSGIGFLWSPNFSIGVNVYLKIVREAAKLVNRLDDYDVWAHEIHHAQKVDAPSGTALAVGDILLEQIERKTAIVGDKLARQRRPDEVHISSVRGGNVNFAHTVGLETDADTIEIKHTARNRDGFALGALKAAEWLAGKSGYFEMADFLKAEGLA